MRVVFEPLVGYANNMCFKSVARIPERMASAKRLMTSRVFASRVPIRLIALDATNKVHIDKEFLREFEAKARSPGIPTLAV